MPPELLRTSPYKIPTVPSALFAGTSLNWAEDKTLNAARILFPGVACFFLAFVAGSITHLLNERHISRQKQLMDQ